MASQHHNIENKPEPVNDTAVNDTSMMTHPGTSEHHSGSHHHPENNLNLSTLIKKETGYLVIIAAVFLIGFKILFYQESVEVIARTVGGIFWMSIVAGFPVMYYWHHQLNFLERITIGGVLGLGLSTVTAYYLSFVGVGLKLSAFLLPPLFGVVGSAMVYLRFFRR